MRKNAVVYLLLMLLFFSSCRVLWEADIANSRKEDFRSENGFVNYPATLVLFRGDTIRGRFTLVYKMFYQIHENNDSNINRTGKENGREGDYYPVSTWYKRFTPEEINTYTVRGKTYESVIQVADINGTDSPWKSSLVFYLPRVTPDSSGIQLYLAFYPRTHGETLDFSDVLADIAWDMIKPGDYTYYFHFPGETPRKVWAADLTPRGLATKTKMAELFSTCPELRSLAAQIKQSPNRKNLIQAIMNKEELNYSKTLPAILAILKKYDECSYRSKN